MNEEHIVSWMRERISGGNFTDAASMAKEFLDENNITNVLDPDFSKTMNAGFKLADEIADI